MFRNFLKLFGLKYFLGAMLVSSPVFVFSAFDKTKILLTNVLDVVNNLILLALAFTVMFFFWGLAKFILASGSEDALTEGKNIMIWGIIAIFVMSSLWGIVAFIDEALGIDNTVYSPEYLPNEEDDSAGLDFGVYDDPAYSGNTPANTGNNNPGGVPEPDQEEGPVDDNDSGVLENENILNSQ